MGKKNFYINFVIVVMFMFVVSACSDSTTQTIGPISDGDVSVDGDMSEGNENLEGDVVESEGDSAEVEVIDNEMTDSLEETEVIETDGDSTTEIEIADGDTDVVSEESDLVEEYTETELVEGDVIEGDVAEESPDHESEVARIHGVIRIAKNELEQPNFDQVVVALFDRTPFQDDNTDFLVQTILHQSDFVCGNNGNGTICHASYEIVWHQAGDYYVYSAILLHDDNGHLIDFPKRLYARTSDSMFYDPNGADIEYNIFLGADANRFNAGVTLQGKLSVNPDYLDDGNYFVVVLSDRQFADGSFIPVQMQVFYVDEFMDTSAGKDDDPPFVMFKFTGIPTDRQWNVAAVAMHDEDSDPFDIKVVHNLPLPNDQNLQDLYLGVPNPNLGSITGSLIFTRPPQLGHIVMVVASNTWPVPHDGTNDWVAGSFTKIIDSDDIAIPYEMYDLGDGTYYVFAMMFAPGLQRPYMAMPNPVAVNIDLPRHQNFDGIDLNMYNGGIHGTLTINITDNSTTPSSVLLNAHSVEDVSQDPPTLLSFCETRLVVTSSGANQYVADYSLSCGAPGYVNIFSACFDMNNDRQCKTEDGDINVNVEPSFFMYPNTEVDVEQDLLVVYPMN